MSTEGSDLFQLWVYLSGTPLLWLTATLVAYVIAEMLAAKSGRHALVNPVLIAATLLIVVLLLSETTYEDYFTGAQFIHFMLGPAIVALAVPLWRHRQMVRRNLLPMLMALLAGSTVAILSAVGIAWWLLAPEPILASLAPKSATVPIAMGLAENIGGLPGLTAIIVVVTGIFGALTVTPLMNALRIQNYAARGFAVGVASHGIGTARAFQVNETAGTFAGIAMGLNGVLTALLLLFWPFG